MCVFSAFVLKSVQIFLDPYDSDNGKINKSWSIKKYKCQRTPRAGHRNKLGFSCSWQECWTNSNPLTKGQQGGFTLNIGYCFCGPQIHFHCYFFLLAYLLFFNEQYVCLCVQSCRRRNFTCVQTSSVHDNMKLYLKRPTTIKSTMTNNLLIIKLTPCNLDKKKPHHKIYPLAIRMASAHVLK